MKHNPIYILGGEQTDFSRNWQREGLSLYDLFSECVTSGLDSAKLQACDIEVGHIGNFVSASYTGQAHLGGFFGHLSPDLAYLPASSHEAACASGSMAILAAMADLESGRYDLACVVGLEMMRVKEPKISGDPLAAAAWADEEWQGADYVWPAAFSDLIDDYQAEFSLDKSYLEAISAKNFANAKLNANAQTRNWDITADSYAANDDRNPTVAGNIRRLDCGQISDGAAVVFLANHERALLYARQHGLELDTIPQIKGWGHINAPMKYAEKRKLAQHSDYLLPHVNQLFKQTLARAGLGSIAQISGLEVHDCFNITEYMILDHSGLCAPGEAWRAIENGDTNIDGRLPINASGGLIGLGHPVGATGVRMLLDCSKQVLGKFDGRQINDVKNMMSLNLGGSTTTCASFIVGL